MTEEQKAAYLISQCVCAIAEIEGMKAENAKRGQSTDLPYGQADFDEIADRFGVHHNAAITLFHG